MLKLHSSHTKLDTLFLVSLFVLFAFTAGICYTIPNMTGGTSPAPLPNFTRRHQTMKVLKALLAVLTTLAVALTAILLLWQDKSAPRYIKIYENEQ